jgi:hypothetical protein
MTRSYKNHVVLHGISYVQIPSICTDFFRMIDIDMTPESRNIEARVE